jgi:predicted RNase H-like HicB family nuclease
MLHYLAIFEDAGSEHAIGVAFPDLPGCFSAGDTFEEAYANAQEAIALWMDDPGLKYPPRPRPLRELQADPDFQTSLSGYGENYFLAAVPYQPRGSQLAAE